MDDLSKFYQLLGLEAGATPEEVKQAYRDLVKVWHPDRFAHDDRLRLMAQDKLKELNGAYELLLAHAFQASIAPEPDATPEAEPGPVTPRARIWPALWMTLGALVLVAAAVFIFVNGRGNKTMFAPQTNGAVMVAGAASTNTCYALKFNLNKSHVVLATTGSLSGTFTVECWALTQRPKQVGTILSSCQPGDCGFNLKFRQGKRFHGDIGDGSRWLMKMANAKFAYERDTWYHVAYVVTPDKYSIYINGVLANSGEIYPAGNPLLFDDAHQLWLGADGGLPDDLDGSIAGIRIWRTARTPTQIEANMNETLPDNGPGLVGNWRFTEGAGTTSADGSGHGFTATLVGDVAWSPEIPASLRR